MSASTIDICNIAITIYIYGLNLSDCMLTKEKTVMNEVRGLQIAYSPRQIFCIRLQFLYIAGDATHRKEYTSLFISNLFVSEYLLLSYVLSQKKHPSRMFFISLEIAEVGTTRGGGRLGTLPNLNLQYFETALFSCLAVFENSIMKPAAVGCLQTANFTRRVAPLQRYLARCK